MDSATWSPQVDFTVLVKNLEGSVRSACVRSTPSGVADLIEAGLNEAAG
ncbi:hypothetical protein CLV78_11933, partial [Aliiruegeria haliotis]